MVDAPINDDEHWITTARRGINGVQKFISALNTPVDPSEYIWKWGILSFNIKNGLFIYGSNKPIQMLEHKTPYKLMRVLFATPDIESTYEQIAIKIGVPYKNPEQKRLIREKLKSILKNIRREIGINAHLHPEQNPFVMSGIGIKLAFIS